MTEKDKLKLIVAYDRNQNQYSLVAHNQSPDEAERRLREEPELAEGCSFIVLTQTRRHRTEEPQQCRACRETVVRSAHLEPQPKFTRRQQ